LLVTRGLAFGTTAPGSHSLSICTIFDIRTGLHEMPPVSEGANHLRANLSSSSLLQSHMGSQSTAKTIFILTSMVGWLIVGAALMYLFPLLADQFVASERTHQWIKTLSGSGYNPMLAIVGGGSVLAVTVLANLIWHQRFEGKI